MKEGLSLRDRALLMILGVVVLYVAGGLVWMMSLQHKWSASMKKYTAAVKKYERENVLIAEADRWNMEYISEKEKMPMFPEGEDVDTHWMDLMDRLATTNYIAISRRQYGKEESKGDVFELPVEVGGWEGSLEGLVQFLWDVQSNEQSMMDVSALTMRPSQKRGFLKGTFTLSCAYMRGDVESGDDVEPEQEDGVPDAEGQMDGGSDPGGDGEMSEDDDNGASPEPDSGEEGEETEESTGKAAENAAEE